MFSRVSEIYQKIIHIYCWLYRIVIYICKVNKAQNKKNINKMNFQELNNLIQSLKKDKKANKDLINFYESKRKQILTEAFNKGFEK